MSFNTHGHDLNFRDSAPISVDVERFRVDPILACCLGAVALLLALLGAFISLGNNSYRSDEPVTGVNARKGEALAETASRDWSIPLVGAAGAMAIAGGTLLRRRRSDADQPATPFEDLSAEQLRSITQAGTAKRRRPRPRDDDNHFGDPDEEENVNAHDVPLTDESQLILISSELALAEESDALQIASRIIEYLEDESEDRTEEPAGPPREIDLQAKRATSPLIPLAEQAPAIAAGSIVPRERFADLLSTELSRHHRGGRDGALISLVLPELEYVSAQLGKVQAGQLFADVARRVARQCRALDSIGLAGPHELAILMPDIDEDGVRAALERIIEDIASTRFTALTERVLLTPATGFALLSDSEDAVGLLGSVEVAREMSMLNRHLDPERWENDTSPVHSAAASTDDRWSNLRERLRTPAQIALTVVISWVLPFLTYVLANAVGVDISWPVYIFFVISLVVTGSLILAEGFMALKQKEPPAVPSQPYPKASAVIAAYLPNEAATIVETVEAFLAVEYPNELQIILAYNTPETLPVEEHLERLAKKHPNFIPIRVVGSSSKAQNVNAAISVADGEFIGMFDADHQPRPDAFTRAWRWIDAGYDVVQGHCLTRNGDANWLTKMVAVEFESIYAVAHPGRAKMHHFGVFGGSNGFWRTELLHGTRMRGSMLTEDIDSSMRVIERGFKIRSDRDLVSRELGTTTFQQIWNQRIRWAQGWFQVSIEHMKHAFRSDALTRRQKFGLFHLLMWREIYPWLSQQLVPLLAFWAVREGGLEQLNWAIPIFVATSIFTFMIGPLQTLFAYKLADDEIKQHRWWFVGYLLFTTPFYTEYKNLIARVAHIKQLLGESVWRVTPRSADDE